jgi:hypothetical protein
MTPGDADYIGAVLRTYFNVQTFPNFEAEIVDFKTFPTETESVKNS